MAIPLPTLSVQVDFNMRGGRKWPPYMGAIAGERQFLIGDRAGRERDASAHA